MRPSFSRHMYLRTLWREIWRTTLSGIRLETLQSTTWIAWCTFSKEVNLRKTQRKKSFEPENRHDYYFLCFVNALLKNFVSFIVLCAVEIVCRDIEMTIFSSKWILVKKTIHVPLCGQYVDIKRMNFTSAMKRDRSLN